EPSEWATRRVRHDDRWSDAIDELPAVLLPQRLRELIVTRGRIGCREELIDERITHITHRARPLFVRRPRRRHRVAREQIVGDERTDLSQRIGVVDRTSVPRTIDKI